MAGGCAVNATGGLLFTALLTDLPLATLPEFWVTWWLGDVVGVLLLAPLVLGEGTLPEPRPLEWTATLVLTLAACKLVFGTPVLGLGGSTVPLAWTVS